MHGMYFASKRLCQVKESLFRHLLAHTCLLGVPHHRCRFPALLPSLLLCLFGQWDSSTWQESLLQPLVTRHQGQGKRQKPAKLATWVVLSARLGGTRWAVCTGGAWQYQFPGMFQASRMIQSHPFPRVCPASAHGSAGCAQTAQHPALPVRKATLSSAPICLLNVLPYCISVSLPKQLPSAACCNGGVVLEMGFKGLPCPKCILKTINPMEDALLEKKTGTALLLEPCETGLRPRPLQRRGCRLSLRGLAPASCTRNKAGRGWGFPAQEAPQASTAPRSQQRARVGRGHTPLHPAGASLPCLLLVLPARRSGRGGDPQPWCPFQPPQEGFGGEESHRTSGMGAGTHVRSWPGMYPLPALAGSCSQ